MAAFGYLQHWGDFHMSMLSTVIRGQNVPIVYLGESHYTNIDCMQVWSQSIQWFSLNLPATRMAIEIQ